ncbi:hypothetical protein PI95_030420 [Hassallia byssoidea VB512170]|uniref:Uncharacterized protein n=1 Tax=Hassallia byssoidea VB512170 TaxID=1304833 RepID=A0A846HID5_9CYAN|nr:hypothetical protein [Hassalia byssoidea]NEU76708.1 hypothetical protein [Hassalia byssoidea VB512170]
MKILAVSLIFAMAVLQEPEPEPPHRGGGRRLQAPQVTILYTTTKEFNYV